MNVALPNLDTTITLQLTKVSSEQTHAFGWAKGNDPVPSSGCGKDTQMSKSGQFKFPWPYKAGVKNGKASIPSFMQVFPIILSDRTANVTLEQNPGY